MKLKISVLRIIADIRDWSGIAHVSASVLNSVEIRTAPTCILTEFMNLLQSITCSS